MVEEILELDVLEIEEEVQVEVVIRKYYINLFFKNREYYYGGSIPIDKLYCPRYLNKIMNIDKVNIENSLNKVYQALEDIFECDSSLSDDILYILNLLGMCAKASIPKEYATGIIIMYLELCEGIEVNI